MSQNNKFLAIPDQGDLFVPVGNGGSEKRSNSPADDEDEEPEDDIRLIPRSSPVPRKRGPSIADETAEYMRIRLAFKRRVSFADATGGELVDVKEFVAFDSDDDESAERWEAEEARYRAAVREPTYSMYPEFQGLTGDDLKASVRTHKVEVEPVSSDPDDPLTFSGTIRVLNISFHKSVYVRSTMDGWGTYFDCPADYVEGSYDGESDQFSFKLSFAQPYLFHGARIDFVVRYETSDGEFWANNNGRNYSVTLIVTFEDRATHASAMDMHNVRGILKPPRPGMDYDDSEDYDDEGARGEPENQLRPVHPVIVHPEMDIDVGGQEQGSLSSTDPSQTTTKTTTTTTAATTTTITEGTPYFSTTTDLTAPTTEWSPCVQQDTTTQASTSLPLPGPELGSDLNHPPQPRQESQDSEPAVQDEVQDVTSVPACHGELSALAQHTIAEDNLGLRSPSETRDTDPKPEVATDIPHQSDLLARAPPCLSLGEEMDENKHKDTRLMSAEEMDANKDKDTRLTSAEDMDANKDKDTRLTSAEDMDANKDKDTGLTSTEEMDANKDKDTRLTSAEDMEEDFEELTALAKQEPEIEEKIDTSERFEGSEEEPIEVEKTDNSEKFEASEEEPGEIEEKIDTSGRFEGLERSTITELESPTSSDILEEHVRNGSTEVVGVEIVLEENADLEEVPRVSLGSQSEISWGPELRPTEESVQAAGEVVSSSAASRSLPTHQSPIHPGPTGEDNTALSQVSLSDTISDADKSPRPLQHPKKPYEPPALEESTASLDSEYTSHEDLAVTSAPRPDEQKNFAEEMALPQYLTIDSHTTTLSTRDASHVPEEDYLDVPAGTKEKKSPVEASCPAILTPGVPENALELPGDSVGTLDGPVSIWRTLRPAMFGMSVVTCSIAAVQEPSILLVLGLYLIVHCF
ncbi:uncharacterized protein si:ch211-167b20.8 [Sardina pilchardus]|uniref:uncharacterized protein si:ch211-167b20.8 n=1 Tax=Sardina pilchardus TaxID=27697 RepID=UPI002E0D50A7